MSSPAEQPAENPRRFDSVEQEAFLNLWRTYDRLHLLEEELFLRYELTPQQYNALRLLRGEGGRKLPTLALAARLVSRAPDITRLLDKLEERGLIERERPADNRRMVLIALTEPGRALLADLDEQVRRCHSRQLGHLSEPQLRELSRLLQEARRPHEDAQSPWRPAGS
jgi:DNA-binding MarR family transcriptional regulator